MAPLEAQTICVFSLIQTSTGLTTEILYLPHVEDKDPEGAIQLDVIPNRLKFESVNA
jgi:hypothetical protein